MLGGLSLLGLVGLPAYMGAAMIDHTVPINIYAVFIVSAGRDLDHHVDRSRFR